MRQVYQVKLNLECLALILVVSIECLMKRKGLGSALVESMLCILKGLYEVNSNDGSEYCK